MIKGIAVLSYVSQEVIGACTEEQKRGVRHTCELGSELVYSIPFPP